MRERVTEEITIDRDRLVEWAGRAIDTPSFTGDEQAMADAIAARWERVVHLSLPTARVPG